MSNIEEKLISNQPIGSNHLIAFLYHTNSLNTIKRMRWERDFFILTNWSPYLKHFIIVESITLCDFLSFRLLSSSQQIPSPPIKCEESKWLFQYENKVVVVNGAYGGLGEIGCVLGLFCGHVISCPSLILSECEICHNYQLQLNFWLLKI